MKPMLDYISGKEDAPEEVKALVEKVSAINRKFQEGETLSLIEQDLLGNTLYSVYNNIDDIDCDSLREFKFKFLVLRYYVDFFEGTYHKLNPDKSLSDPKWYKFLKNKKQKFVIEEHENKKQFLIQEGVLIQVPPDEIARHKAYLIADAKGWAKEITEDGHHPDYNLRAIGKELKETFKLKEINNYLNKNIEDEKKYYDITKAIIKSKYVHFEALKCLEEMSLEGRKSVFPFLNGEVHYTYSSIIHIMNRHFAQLLSSSNISSGKSFHNTNIDPYKMDLLIGEIFSEIEKTGLRKNESLVPNTKVYFQYKSSDYAIFMNKMKYDKTKFEVRTFTEIDNLHEDGKNFYMDIKNNHHPVPVNDDLSIYYSIK